MESNNIVIKMYLFYTQQKFTEDNPRATWRLPSARAGVVVNVGKGSGGPMKGRRLFRGNRTQERMRGDLPGGE